MSIFQIIVAFGLAILVVYLIFWFYRYYRRRTVVHRQSEVLVEGQHDATKYVVVDRRRIPLSVQGNEYAISFWIFVKDYNYRYGSNKMILYRGDKENSESNPFIYLNPRNNDMTIKLQLQTDTVDQNLKDIEQQAKAIKDTKTEGETKPEEEPDASEVGTPAPTLENFVVPLPVRYFRPSKKEQFSNISGNTTEYFEETPSDDATGATTAAPEGDSQPETIGGLDNRLDKVELQVQKLIGIKEKEDKDKAEEDQGQVDAPEEKMPIVYDECVVRNLPLQKWTHVAISVFNNHVEVYLDGKLHKACSLKGFPKPNLQNLHINANGGFNGFLSNLEYSNMTVTTDEVYNTYRQGPKLVKGLGDKMKGVWNGFASVFKE